MLIDGTDRATFSSEVQICARFVSLPICRVEIFGHRADNKSTPRQVASLILPQSLSQEPYILSLRYTLFTRMSYS